VAIAQRSTAVAGPGLSTIEAAHHGSGFHAHDYALGISRRERNRLHIGTIGFLCRREPEPAPRDATERGNFGPACTVILRGEEAGWPRKLALPYAISAVVARMLALEQGKETQPDLVPRTRLRTASGHWLVLHASRLSGSSTQGQIAVIVEVARPVEIAPLIAQAYDLSRRESEIMQSVLRGWSTVEMTDTFHISSHTVQDHLKAIFEKVGVRSRRELVGQLFAQQYQPRIVSGRDLDANGWFT
jgi:DNA-binding CsgD family transcriptional regulator